MKPNLSLNNKQEKCDHWDWGQTAAMLRNMGQQSLKRSVLEPLRQETKYVICPWKTKALSPKIHLLPLLYQISFGRDHNSKNVPVLCHSGCLNQKNLMGVHEKHNIIKYKYSETTKTFPILKFVRDIQLLSTWQNDGCI